jgi:hypothetical protein
MLRFRAPEGERPLLDLRANECRWPTTETTPTVIGLYLFCGKPTRPGESYCKRHLAQALPGRRQH